MGLTALACGAQTGFSGASGPVETKKSSLALAWPEGYSYNPETRELTLPEPAGAAAQATLPVYVTKITLTISGPGMDPVVLNVPLDTLTVEFAVPAGEKTFTLLVETNIAGLSFSDSVTLALIPGAGIDLDFSMEINAPPTVEGISGPSSTYKRTPVTFTVNVTDLDPDDTLTYTWDGGGGSVSGSGSSISWSAGRKGTYTVCVTVDDGGGTTVNDCADINVLNRDPVIRSVTASNSTPVAGETVTVTVDAYDPDGDRLSFAWSDGGAQARTAPGGGGGPGAYGWTASGYQTQYTPDSTGTRTLTVTADDGDGGRTSSSVSMNVKPNTYRIDINGVVPGCWDGDGDIWTLNVTAIGDDLRLTCDAITLGQNGSNLEIIISDDFNGYHCSGSIVVTDPDLADTEPPTTLQWNAAQSMYCLEILETCTGGDDNARYDCYLLSNAPVTATLQMDTNPP
ncbi:MAG: PKD domain-containing protein [Candidatus Nitrospinota bacterium M3_3B_026]